VAAASLLALLAGCGGSDSTGTMSSSPLLPSSSSAAPSSSSPTLTGSATPSSAPTSSSAAPGSSASSSTTTTPSQPAPVDGYVPLWPFVGITDAQAWERSYRAGGHQPWHLSAGETALSFTRGYLGFTELDRVITTSMLGDGAHVGVGYRNPAGRLSTASILHLIRMGAGTDAPWEVVGSDDKSFTLDVPAYAATVRSPVRVSGLMSGVDERIVVAFRQQWAQAPLVTSPGIPAGGVAQRWSVTIPLSRARSGALTIVASTGGHLQRVERFAISGVRVF